MSDLLRELHGTDQCYCGSQVIDGELKLVACLFHKATAEIERLELKNEILKQTTIALTAEVSRLAADIASHERFGKEFMAENRRLGTVLRDIKNLSPTATDHFDPFQTAKQMAAMAMDTDSGRPTP